jgi:predicted transcriptional regulator of viral defense system
MLGRLAELAEDQWGLITRAQTRAAGVPPATLARLADVGGPLERIAHGVYRLRGTPVPPVLDLRVAWLQLAPDVPAWQRTRQQGVVSHRSAAAMLGLGDLPADQHEFTVPRRQQTRRRDVRLHCRPLREDEWTRSAGDVLPYTRASRLVVDLLIDREEPSAVAAVVADALERVLDDPKTLATALNPFAARFGLPPGDGGALLGQLVETTGFDPARYLAEIN